MWQTQTTIKTQKEQYIVLPIIIGILIFLTYAISSNKDNR